MKQEMLDYRENDGKFTPHSNFILSFPEKNWGLV